MILAIQKLKVGLNGIYSAEFRQIHNWLRRFVKKPSTIMAIKKAC